MEIENKQQKSRDSLATLGITGFWILCAITERNKEEHSHDGFLMSVLAKMKQWCEEPFTMDDLRYWCPLLFRMGLIGIAESEPQDQRYSLSFDAQRLVLRVTIWAKAESKDEEWASWLPRQHATVPSPNQVHGGFQARAA